MPDNGEKLTLMISRDTWDYTSQNGTPCVLSIDSSAIAFRRFTGASIPAGKAYYVVATP